jgi:uncharacterized damage-inducible protein DinB
MTAKDTLKTALTSTQHMLGMFVADLSDADFLVRPVPTANHIAWQLGHLISAEHQFIGLAGGADAAPKLPEGWGEQHGKKTAHEEPPKRFATKAQYLELFNKTREAALGTLAKLSDADLDKPTTGDMAKFAPTTGSLFLLMANHTMMHAGQFTVVRRKLGKPVLF